jgi:hypothetical protein
MWGFNVFKQQGLISDSTVVDRPTLMNTSDIYEFRKVIAASLAEHHTVYIIEQCSKGSGAPDCDQFICGMFNSIYIFTFKMVFYQVQFLFVMDVETVMVQISACAEPFSGIQKPIVNAIHMLESLLLLCSQGLVSLVY